MDAIDPAWAAATGLPRETAPPGAAGDAAGPVPPVELVCRSNFSFLTGASHPEELVARAAELGYAALALSDECSLAGIVRAHEETRRQRLAGRPLQLLCGSLFTLEPGPQALDGLPPAPLRLVLLARDREGYGDLAELISLGRGRCSKGRYRLHPQDLLQPPPDTGLRPGLPGCLIVWLPEGAAPPPPEASEPADGDLPDRPAGPLPEPLPLWRAQAQWLARHFPAPPGEPPRVGIGLVLLRLGEDEARIAALEAVAAASGLPLLPAGDVLMHRRARKPLQDTLSAIRLGRPLADCGRALAPNAEQHLRDALSRAALFRPAWQAAALAFAQRCRFSLSELRYEYPDELVPPGHSPASHLRTLTAAGAARRYPQGVPAAVAAQIERELALIALKAYEPFFLTVHDAVVFARGRGILCQGRGSAANSAVCYCLGITEVDPQTSTLLFERFISAERDEPPDIDVDFEHERREEVIQYLYAKYGRQRCAMAAALSTYRVRGAVREVGQALGFAPETIERLAASLQGFDAPETLPQRMAELGLPPDAPGLQRWQGLVQQLIGFPRHLSQHSGGIVIARGRLTRLVPIEPAAMERRSVIQWDKDDLEALGLLKVDVLALGMLSLLRRALAGLTAWRGPLPSPEGPRPWTLADLPREDAATYAMIQRADTVGLFQIESRAQQAMLPRLRPACFYELVVQVAIVRPGPIQGGMVHPYLRRKQGLEPARSPYPALDDALGRTLGVPIFQEQVMQLCMIAAGFSGGEADQLRRAMAAWRRKGGVGHFHARIVEGMTARGYARDFAEQLFRQIEGFGEYGFPESHATSFALLAYLSAWLKCHEPAIYLAAVLDAQPLGFYAPAQLVQDARRHGVVVRPVDVQHSDWDCRLEPPEGELPGPAESAPVEGPAWPDRGRPGQPAVRLGLRQVASLGRADAQALVEARRAGGPFRDLEDLRRRSGLGRPALQALARADALRCLAGPRRQQLWAASAPGAPLALDGLAAAADAPPPLPPMPEAEAIAQDHARLGLSLRRHPLALLRPRLAARGLRSARELAGLADDQPTWACGLVLMRQAPGTAGGTVFLSLEDETGCTQVIVDRRLRERQRTPLLQARLLAVAGRWQLRHGIGQLRARHLLDLSDWLGALQAPARNFR